MILIKPSWLSPYFKLYWYHLSCIILGASYGSFIGKILMFPSHKFQLSAKSILFQNMIYAKKIHICFGELPIIYLLLKVYLTLENFINMSTIKTDDSFWFDVSMSILEHFWNFRNIAKLHKTINEVSFFK